MARKSSLGISAKGFLYCALCGKVSVVSPPYSASSLNTWQPRKVGKGLTAQTGWPTSLFLVFSPPPRSRSIPLHPHSLVGIALGEFNTPQSGDAALSLHGLIKVFISIHGTGKKWKIKYSLGFQHLQGRGLMLPQFIDEKTEVKEVPSFVRGPPLTWAKKLSGKLPWQQEPSTQP